MFSVPANSSSPGRLVHRHRLARDRRLIDARMPGDHLRVERDPLPGLHADQRADGDGRDVDELLVVADQHAGAGGGEVHQRRDDPAAALERHRLQPGADREQHEHPGAFGVLADARPRRPRRAPSARSCPAGGGAGRARRPARSASRRPPSRAGTAARPPPAAPTPAKPPPRRRAGRSRRVVERARASRRQNGVSSCSIVRAAGSARYPAWDTARVMTASGASPATAREPAPNETSAEATPGQRGHGVLDRLRAGAAVHALHPEPARPGRRGPRLRRDGRHRQLDRVHARQR